MSLVKVREYFKKYGMEDRIVVFSESSATVELAAKAIGCEGKLIAKTMGFITDNPIVIVVAGDMKIDNSKYKHEFGCKAKMIGYDQVSELTGHEIGGVCPFAVNDNVSVYLDVSLKRFDYVYPACGSHDSAIKLTINELEKYSNYIKWVDVCRSINEEK